MTPAEVKAVRARLGISQRELAGWLRLSANGDRTVYRWESGDIPISGPAQVALEAFDSGWRPV